jgi:hypothetical protein
VVGGAYPERGAFWTLWGQLSTTITYPVLGGEV